MSIPFDSYIPLSPEISRSQTTSEAEKTENVAGMFSGVHCRALSNLKQ